MWGPGGTFFSPSPPSTAGGDGVSVTFRDHPDSELATPLGLVEFAAAASEVMARTRVRAANVNDSVFWAEPAAAGEAAEAPLTALTRLGAAFADPGRGLVELNINTDFSSWSRATILLPVIRALSAQSPLRALTLQRLQSGDFVLLADALAPGRSRLEKLHIGWTNAGTAEGCAGPACG